MNLKLIEIKGGYLVPDNDLIGGWQREAQRLDHDGFLVPYICELISPGAIVFDCGAFNGDHAIAYSKAVGETGKVFCFEGGPIFEALEHNVQLFPFKNTMAIKCILSNEMETQVDLNESIENSGSNHFSFSEHGKLRTRTLDSILFDFEVKRLDLIKIDCEGFEPLILQGAIAAIKRFRPKIVFEVNQYRLKDLGYSTDYFHNFFKSLDYKLMIIEPKVKWDDQQFDVLAVPL